MASEVGLGTTMVVWTIRGQLLMYNLDVFHYKSTRRRV